MRIRLHIILFLLICGCANHISAQSEKGNKIGQKSDNNLDLIETYRHDGEGYNPYLIGPKWQVAQLNYMPSLAPEEIKKMDVHHETDETFLLIKGEAVLIAGEIKNEHMTFEVLKMKPGVLYNIPKGLWHNIAMKPGAEVSITEDANTHLGDYEFFYLNDDQIKELEQLIKESFLKQY